MSLLLPWWLPPEVLAVVAGHFPEAREDAMRREADELSAKAERLRRGAEFLSARADGRRAVLGGAGGEEFATQCRDTAAECNLQADR
ncbi:hypothetical protein ACWCPQ_28500, partial [Nocardia sp. NPDC001965]